MSQSLTPPGNDRNFPPIQSSRAFTLFEVLIALGVFALGFMGLMVALESAMSAGLESRDLAFVRSELESRMAFCLAVPPPPGVPRKLSANENRGIAIEETFEPFPAQNQDGEELTGLWLLTIRAEWRGIKDSAETVIYQP
jgi:hypothetical protein